MVTSWDGPLAIRLRTSGMPEMKCEKITAPKIRPQMANITTTEGQLRFLRMTGLAAGGGMSSDGIGPRLRPLFPPPDFLGPAIRQVVGPDWLTAVKYLGLGGG